jgi:hypothetical protein
VKKLAPCVIALLLAGCSSERGTSTYSQFFQLVRQSIDGQNSDALRAQAVAIPYASLSFRLGSDSPRILVLATDTSGDRIWTSASKITLLTRDGRIARTVGLKQDLSAQTTDSTQALPSPFQAVSNPFASVRREDFRDIGVYGAILNCRAAVVGRRTIKIIGQAIQTVRVDESCESPTLDWSFVDNFWLDPQSGLAWRTIQHVHPHSKAIETNILRPPG